MLSQKAHLITAKSVVGQPRYLFRLLASLKQTFRFAEALVPQDQ
jgi:hypothetical protein